MRPRSAAVAADPEVAVAADPEAEAAVDRWGWARRAGP